MPRKIKLLYTVMNLEVGGAQDLVKTLAAGMDPARYDVSVATASGDEHPTSEPLVEEVRGSGIEVYRAGMTGWVDEGPRRRFIEYISSRGFDIVHSHLFPIDLWASRAARLAGVPVAIYSKHESYTNKPLLVRLSRALKLNRNADLALATSELTRRHLIRYEFIPPWKVRVVPNPVDSDYFDPSRFDGSGVRAELGIPVDAPVVGNIVRLVRRKGVGSFIEACGRIAKKRPDCRFLLVGDGYMRAELEARASDAGIGNMIFAGTRRDLGELFAAMDVFMFTPYWGEALPLVMLEAMCMKKGIVASNVCSNNELVEDGVNGYLPTPSAWKKGVESLDAGALADAAVRLLDDAGLRKRFGEAARERAVSGFGVEAVTRVHDAIYTEMLEKKGVSL